MANYATLKAAIAAAIKQNGNKEITGNLLQQQLLAMVNSLGAGYQYVGIATTETNPGTPDQNVFYLASTAGTYANFGGLVLADGEIAILKYNGTWAKDSTGAASLEIVNQLGQEINGKILFSGNKTIQVGQYRSITTGFPVLSKDSVAQILVNGISEGYVQFLTSGWAGDTVNFVEGQKTFCIIPANRPNFIVGTKNNVPVSQDTVVSITIIYDGISNAVEYEKQENDLFKKSIPFMDISKLYPTGGTDGTDIYTKANARNMVPNDKREYGLILMYKTANGIVIEQYPGDDVSSTPWLYSSWHELGISDIINLNTYHKKTDAYSSIQDAKDAVPGYWRRGGIIIRFKLANGWVTMQLNNDSWTTVDDKWQTIATDVDIDGIIEQNFNILKQIDEFTLQKNDLINAYWAGVVLTPVSTRVSNKYLIPVKAGDEISILDYTFEFAISVIDSNNTTLESRLYGYYPYTVIHDGFACITVENRTSPATEITIDELVGKIQISQFPKKSFGRPSVEFCSGSDFVKGYIDSSYNILPHNKRCVNWQRMRVFKGDYVYPFVNNVQLLIHEFSNNNVHLASSGRYYQNVPSPWGGSAYCGAYVVQNDGYIMCQCAYIDDAEITDLNAFDKCICVIHINTDAITRIANAVLPVVPTSPKRGDNIPLPQDYGHLMQSGTIIGNELWFQSDAYTSAPDSKKIIVVNKDTGALIRTIVTSLHGCMSYNKYNDCLLINEGNNYYIFKNPATIGDTLSIENADYTISNIGDGIGCSCWGEDDRIIYCVVAKTEDPATDRSYNWLIRKLLLGVDANNEYDGTFTEICTFTGDVKEGLDTYHGLGLGNQNYAQDVDYDGFLYLAMGTSGSNYLVIDLNENRKIFTVVGNYFSKYYDENRVEHYLEPELIALDGNKIYCGGRNYSENLYSLLRYYR